MEGSTNPTLGYPNLEAIEWKENNETDLLMTVQLVKEDDFQGHQGFDLYDPEQVEWETLSISKLATYKELAELIACIIKRTVDQFRIWPMVGRDNNTVRPKALDWETCLGKSVHDVAENCNLWTCFLELLPPDSGLSALPPFEQDRMVLLFFKYYDAATNKILYAGHHYALIDRPLADLVPILLQRADLPPRTQLEFYEEMKPGMIKAIERVDKPLKTIVEDLMDGDIICYQKYDLDLMGSQLGTVQKYFHHLLPEVQPDTQSPNDIVANLHEKGVAHIFEEICSYLDYSDIKSATQVCRNWRHLLTSNMQIWKSLLNRNIARLPPWNLLYKRAICQRSDPSLPEWSPQEACRAIEDVYQQTLRNLHQGKFAEKVDNESCLHLFDVGSTKMVRAGWTNQIHVQNRWRLDESPTSFNVTDQHSTVTYLKISEPYLFVVVDTLNYQKLVIVWDLEKERKMCEFSLDRMDIDIVKIECYNDVLITCCTSTWDRIGNLYRVVNVLTARQMPCSSHPEVNFPVIDELTIPDICEKNTIHVEDQRIVLLSCNDGPPKWAKVNVISVKPFRVIRVWELDETGGVLNIPWLDGFNVDLIEPKAVNYWNGWVLQSQYDATDTSGFIFARIRLTNIDSGEVIMHQIKHLDFDVANNHLLTFSYSGYGVWKLDVFSLPNSNGPKEVKFLYSIIQCQEIHPERDRYILKIHFDGFQFLFCLYKKYFQNVSRFFAVKDFVC